ncbi:helix-turn-helix domain-containing protein [Roseovarius sp. S1116L3]|uniref:arsenate reductase/protein-tyrosine-phosphatase family protein n=1 Tax=Roseovarius roseus TaxID=3342636 RepID=UPI00372B05B7
MKIDIPDMLTTLGHPQRLALFRLLMRRYPDRVPAGELSEALGVKASTMSSYLAALQRAGLAQQLRIGTSLLYSVRMDRVQSLFGSLFADCCLGRPELCIPFNADPHPVPDRKYGVLFVCTGNSARSIFAESILRAVAGGCFDAYSAGTRPSSDVSPQALQVLRKNGHDIALLRAKSVAEFSGLDAPRLDFVFTVCDQSANEYCPAWDGQPVSGHWGVPDPVAVIRSDAEKALAFQQAYDALKRRIAAFAALPLHSLSRMELQSAIDDIARTSKGNPA